MDAHARRGCTAFAIFTSRNGLCIRGRALAFARSLQIERCSFDVDQLPALAAEFIEKPDHPERIADVLTVSAGQPDREKFLRPAAAAAHIGRDLDRAVLPVRHWPRL